MSSDKPAWTFKEYVTDNGTSVISKWRRKAKKKGLFDNAAESRLITAMDILGSLENTKLWDMPYYRKMVDMEGIGEIRTKNKQGVPIRLFGTFLDEEKTFVILIAATHDQDVYDPQDAKETAVDRQMDVLKFGQEIAKFKYNPDAPDDDDDDTDTDTEEEDES